MVSLLVLHRFRYHVTMNKLVPYTVPYILTFQWNRPRVSYLSGKLSRELTPVCVKLGHEKNLFNKSSNTANQSKGDM